MDWHSSTVLVGFYDRLSPSSIRNTLKNIQGYIDIQHVYDLTPVVLVEVEPNLMSEFMRTVVSIVNITILLLHPHMRCL